MSLLISGSPHTDEEVVINDRRRGEKNYDYYKLVRWILDVLLILSEPIKLNEEGNIDWWKDHSIFLLLIVSKNISLSNLEYYVKKS